MPTWGEVSAKITSSGTSFDVVRKQYAAEVAEVTGRNVILYYSGWLQKSQLIPHGLPIGVDDSDKNGFMATIHQLDRSKGLDLLLHTPGGDVAATESLVDYLRSMFGDDIRAIVPQLAMSAGTMIALSCKEVLLGKHSSLGPIDPQLGGMPAHGIVEEFNRAKSEISTDPTTIAVWQPIIAKYTPTLIGECEKAIDWANDMVKKWLTTGMFVGLPDADDRADAVLKELGDHSLTLSHSRHISAEKAKDLGIKVVDLEDNDDLQEAVLSLHHACIQTLSETHAFKIIENQNGVSFVSSVNAT
ncbi:SDH family Clp fold serine proteinase [Rhodococcus sp. IEGM 1343]|uniref:SDH family Clp fold serine proteinase n=1 Tax=Rhodococcus sp. IEGM 1343 TaxID=3082224 RepID=UPI002954A7C4|nr:ATP-dependent Clp protease proteolytic subunit [Rhodococcus sp. IEGM 1343]MDV8058233.1 ATP-dependent Clp protease proteolytic subunit [Rhodococcus sp. IEGM 1343]